VHYNCENFAGLLGGGTGINQWIGLAAVSEGNADKMKKAT
jgi:hypothetical protein